MCVIGGASEKDSLCQALSQSTVSSRSPEAETYVTRLEGGQLGRKHVAVLFDVLERSSKLDP